MAHIIDGKAMATQIRDAVATATAQLSAAGLTPGLGVVLAGDDPASAIYVRNKGVQARAAGIFTREVRLPATAGQAAVIAEVTRLNKDPDIHGILVQLPLPPGTDTAAVLAAIDPAKDVDGFHPLNAGRLASGDAALTPCTPLGCVLLLKSHHARLAGMHAVILGRSNIVGKPLAQLLLAEDCTVTLAHSQSVDLPSLCRSADILIAAVGRAGLVRADWVRAGATVIDVGINRIDDGTPKERIVGDVAFDEVCGSAGAITPVPGGVGPMTIACLLVNTVAAACAARSMPVPAPLADHLPRQDRY